MNIAAIAEQLETAEAEGVAEGVLGWGDPERTAIALGRARLVADGADSPLTRAYGLGFDGPVDAAQIEEVSAFFRSRGQAPRVEVCPYADHSLLLYLRAAGYGIEAFKDVFYRALPEEEIFSEPPDGVTIETVTSASTDLAAAVIGASFADGAPSPAGEALMRRLLAQPDVTGFLARVEGEPAGGGILAVRGGRAALFAAGTLPSARRRGIQAALIRARLLEGRLQGATVATVQASPGSATRRNAERLGFALAYTKATVLADAAG